MVRDGRSDGGGEARCVPVKIGGSGNIHELDNMFCIGEPGKLDGELHAAKALDYSPIARFRPA